MSQTFATREEAIWPPGDGFTPIDAGKNWRGLPDGFHTGGTFLSADGKEVWKPLHGLWHVNNEVILDGTREADCLDANADLRSFPRNWRVEEAAGKRWLIRPRAIVINSTAKAVEYLDLAHVEQIERDIRTLNQRGWCISDDITIAVYRGQRFVLDLSTARPKCKIGWDDDSDHVRRWVKECVALDWLAYQRYEGHAVLNPLSERNHDQPGGWDEAMVRLAPYHHVYVSMYRPMDAMWAPREWLYVQGTNEDMREGRVHTWVLTQEPIPQAKKDSLELRWAWSPWDFPLEP